MSLNKKILISFFISAAVIANLVAFELLGFVEIKKQIRNLELTDTIRSKTLQLRRHEKNFFLYSPQKSLEESRAVHDYIGQIREIIRSSRGPDKEVKLSALQELVDDYAVRFSKVERDAARLKSDIAREREAGGPKAEYLRLVELTFLEQPQKGAEFLVDSKTYPPGSGLVEGLKVLDDDIRAIRQNGEEIISLSKELDSEARGSVDETIFISQVAMFVFFPIFLVVGLGSFFYVMRSIRSRLGLLMNAIESTGRGPRPYKTVDGPGKGGGDEVDLLITKFNDMEHKLEAREEELGRTSAELHQAKKLAAIGTLASGVAHELNNPLNNIYVSAQVLAKEAGADASPVIKEVVGDIVGQTARVKRIVGDLLEYARGREPQPRSFDAAALTREVRRLLSTTSTYSMEGIEVNIIAEGKVMAFADPEQVERVFINLFTNAAEAIGGGGGKIGITLKEEADNIRIVFSDSGPGIAPGDLEKIFEPFYTTKNKGTGLGLAIVFNIVQKNCGGIKVESIKGEGTTFTITLPKG